MAYYDVLDKCPAPALAAARLANDNIAAFRAGLLTAGRAAAAVQAAMSARLNASRALVQRLQAEPVANVTIPALASSAWVWFGGDPQPVCYRLPDSVNSLLSSKFLVLIAPSGAYTGSAVLGPAGSPLPTAASACVSFAVPRSFGAGPFTLAVQDGASGNYLAGFAFAADVLSVAVTGLSYGPGWIRLTVVWSLQASHASAQDTVKVIDKAGKVVLSFLPSQVVSPRGLAAPSGNYSFTLKKTSPPSPAGGFAVKMYPANQPVAAGTALNWVPWANLGW